MLAWICSICSPRRALLGEHFLTLRDADGTLEAEVEVVAHLLDAHAAALEAGEAANPLRVVLVKDAAVVLVALDVGHQALVAVELQRLISHAQLSADLHHGVCHVKSPFRAGPALYHRQRLHGQEGHHLLHLHVLWPGAEQPAARAGRRQRGVAGRPALLVRGKRGRGPYLGKDAVDGGSRTNEQDGRGPGPRPPIYLRYV